MWITETQTVHAGMPLTEVVNAQLLMVAGFVMLGWVLARRQLKLRKRVNQDTRAAKKALKTIREHREPAVPLCDAPAETQRWQVALFDLQRELKAELDTRIAVVQSLTRQLDRRIAMLSHLQNDGLQNDGAGSRPVENQRVGITPQQQHSIAKLMSAGHTSTEIAEQTGISVDDVERIIGTMLRQKPLSP